MTKLEKTVRRTTTILLDNRAKARVHDEIVVSLYPNREIGFRPKGRRKEVRLPLAAVYAIALKEQADAARKERKAKK